MLRCVFVETAFPADGAGPLHGAGAQSASEKLALFLCMLVKRVRTGLGAHRSVTLPMCRADIADFLALTTETVSRTAKDASPNLLTSQPATATADTKPTIPPLPSKGRPK